MAEKIILNEQALDEIRALEREIGTDLLRQLLQSYMQTAPGLLQQMRTALEANDGNGVFTAAHSIKSSSAYVGAEQVVELAEQLEELGRNNNLATAKLILSRLESVYEDTAKLLQTLIKPD